MIERVCAKRKKSGRVGLMRMTVTRGMKVMAVTFVLGMVAIGTAEASDASYFLFQPPYGGRPQEGLAEKRSDSGNELGSPISNSISAADSLWIGSHKINWSPLPLLLKFTNPSVYQLQKSSEVNLNSKQAQPRKYDHYEPYEPFSSPTKEPYAFQKPTPYSHTQSKPPPPPPPKAPHQSHSNSPKFTFPSFNLFGPRPQSKPQPPPKPQLYQLHPYPTSQQKIEPRISNGYVSPTPLKSRNPNSNKRIDVSTPSPIFVSTSASILVSPPGTIRALSTPGASLRPIVDRLKKMTQWSQKKQQKKLVKKDGKVFPPVNNPEDPLERRIRLKKRLSAKSQKHNIEDIILADDNENEADFLDDTTSSTERQPKIIVKQKRSKTRATGGGGRGGGGGGGGVTSMSRESVEVEERERERDKKFSNDIVIIHPKSIYFSEPLSVQPSTRIEKAEEGEVRRKDKKMGLFKSSSQDGPNRPQPVSFRFTPEDARVSPYFA